MASDTDRMGSLTLIGTLFIVTFVSALPVHAEQQTIRSAADFHMLSDKSATDQMPFEFEGLVTFVNAKNRFVVADRTGSVAIDSSDQLSDVMTGDVVRVHGKTELSLVREHVARRDSIRRLKRHQPLPTAVEINERLVRSGSVNYQLVRAHGIIADAFKDEIDLFINIFILRTEADTLIVSLTDSNLSENKLVSLIGAKVNVSGICMPLPGDRQFMPPYIEIPDIDSLTVVSPPLADIDAIPFLETFGHVSPDHFAQIGLRRITGRVLATWQGSELLVGTDDGRKIRVTLARGQELPPVSTHLHAVGFPEADNFCISLKGGLVKATDVATNSTDEIAQPVSGTTLMTGKMGKREINNKSGNKLVRIRGQIVSIPSPNDKSCRIGLESDGFTIPIDVSSHPDIQDLVTVGCRAEISGICILQPTQWSNNVPIQRITELFIVPRSAQDVAVLSRPPWLTVQRLLIVIGSLLAIIVGIFIRNRRLNRIIERRSRELMREEIAHARADLKVEERTRLAVELHDTLSQNITGVALQIDAAQTAAEKDPASVLPYLEVTQRKMQNCRENLRNCLWDLRSRAFEEENLGDAIRKTIAHHLGKSTADIDCDIPCRGLSDNTIHAVLCIIRELTVNAIRHGNAAQISISSKQTDGRLSFVVRDNGCGFDPATRPGMTEGHFGLQGIDERIRRLDGTWQIDSKPGCGCTVTIENLLATN